jgi:inner membrane protease subunit 1
LVAHPWRVTGPSMAPTLRDGDIVLVDRWTLRQRPPRRGELVLLRLSGERGGARIKRVDTVYRQAFGYATATSWSDLDAVDVAWVLGDNPPRSHDSRHHGPVGLDTLGGRVVWRYWPPSRFGPVPSGD